jgi:Holliday junction resolvase RusA-like endonuclease
MTQSFFIPGPLPGMNDFAGKKSRWHYGLLKRNWNMTISLYIKQAKLKPMPCVRVSFLWHERNKRRDPDNVMSGAKFILDALVSCKILPDDGWDEIRGITHSYTVSATNPGVMVVLEEVQP